MPLAVVTPTLDAAVLHALAATTARTSGAQVHRMAGTGSPDGVRRVLARLVGQGVVLAEEHPSATFYLLNQEHVAADAVAGAPVRASEAEGPEPKVTVLWCDSQRRQAQTAVLWTAGLPGGHREVRMEPPLGLLRGEGVGCDGRWGRERRES